MSENTKKTQDEKGTRTVRCVVKSAKMNKSRVGIAEWRMKDPRCGKYIRHRTRVMFHDEQNLSHEGDHVIVASTSPVSTRKSFKLVEIVKKARA